MKIKEYYIVVGINEGDLENIPVVSNIFDTIEEAEKFLEQHPSCGRKIYTRFIEEVK